MIKLYTWGPTTAETVINQTIAPDIGHSALEVTDQGGAVQAYASFWPERDSLIGRITQIWKHRQERNPTTYSQEIDPQQGYMQRAADHADEIIGPDEAMVVRLWENLRHSEYDFLKWNCASVCKLLILGSAPTQDDSVKELALSASELVRLNDPDELLAALRAIAASPFVVSHPEELRHLAEAYAVAEHT
jgi:hypothetical protein